MFQWCNTCFRDTFHDLLLEQDHRQEQGSQNSGKQRSATVRCRGCRTWSIRHEDQPAGATQAVRVEPPRLRWRPPEWLSQLREIAPEVVERLNEIYLAANDRQYRLLSMGVRSGLDHVMLQIVGNIGSFQKKLTAMQGQGYLSSQHRDMLGTVIDAGSAAAHRGYVPPRDLLQAMLTVMESVIRDHYITEPMLRQMKQHIPPRP